MCGIAGIFSWGADLTEADEEQMGAALRLLAHRGPDDSGLMRLPRYLAGHTRLSIIDHAGGHQPMVDEETGVIIVFNGEIYNYIELREKLKREGHLFRTQSDTEVILIGYRAYGIQIVHKLNGMFSFAIYDPRDEALHLSRDRFGEKPLYYYLSGSKLYFASELTALREFSNFPDEIDESAVVSYFALGFIHGPGTLQKGVRQLGHAHYMTASARGCQEYQYYQRHTDVSFETSVSDDEIIAVLEDAIRLRMRADVPVATLLSGGLDSSLITVHAQRHSSQPIKTFAFGWKGLADELPYARQVASLVGSDHTEIELDQAMFLDEIESVVTAMDMPQSDSAAFVVYRLCKEIADRGVKVVLSGEGGDELFGGYPWYQSKKSIKSTVKRLLYGDNRLRADYVLGKHNFSKDELLRWFSKDLVNQFIDMRFNCYAACQSDDANSRIHFDYQTLLPWALMPKVDRMSMAHSVEVRAPLLDPGLVDQWAGIPSRDKVQDSQLKVRIKNLCVKAGILPSSIVYRDKLGMNLPITWWIRNNEGFFREAIEGADSYARDLFGQETINSWFDSLSIETSDGWSRSAQRIWAASVFDLWIKSRCR